MSALANLLARLDGVREAGNGHYRARCPAHESRGLSLAITEGHNGAVLIKCFAECETEDVLHAVGLTFSDCYPDGGRDRARHPRRGPYTDWKRITRALLVDGNVIEIAVNQDERGDLFTPEDRERVRQALDRIAALRKVVGAA